MKYVFYNLVFLLLLVVRPVSLALTIEQTEISNCNLHKNSILHFGNYSKLEQVLSRAESGEKIVIGAIGGSITMGALAAKPEKRYVNLVSKWFVDTFPKAEILLFNAGIGATDSQFGAFRIGQHLLQYQPDLVIVEFSINDSENDLAGETFEGLIRQLIYKENGPAVLILAMMNAWGKNVEEKHLPVAIHYDLPMLSFRQVFEPLIIEDQIDPKMILADSVHPNDKGHLAAADMITLYLERIRKCTEGNRSIRPVVLKALYSDRYENVEFKEAVDIQPEKAKGWYLQPHSKNLDQPWRLHGRPLFDKAWVAKEPESRFIFKYAGSALALTFWKEKGDMGKAEVFIDGSKVQTLNGWGPQEWGGFAKTVIMGQGLSPREHVVEIRIIQEKSAGSNGHSFFLLAYGCAE